MLQNLNLKQLPSVEQAAELRHILLLSAQIELKNVEIGSKISLVPEGKCFILDFPKWKWESAL